MAVVTLAAGSGAATPPASAVSAGACAAVSAPGFWRHLLELNNISRSSASWRCTARCLDCKVLPEDSSTRCCHSHWPTAALPPPSRRRAWVSRSVALNWSRTYSSLARVLRSCASSLEFLRICAASAALRWARSRMAGSAAEAGWAASSISRTRRPHFLPLRPAKRLVYPTARGNRPRHSLGQGSPLPAHQLLL